MYRFKIFHLTSQLLSFVFKAGLFFQHINFWVLQVASAKLFHFGLQLNVFILNPSVVLQYLLLIGPTRCQLVINQVVHCVEILDLWRLFFKLPIKIFQLLFLLVQLHHQWFMLSFYFLVLSFDLHCLLFWLIADFLVRTELHFKELRFTLEIRSNCRLSAQLLFDAACLHKVGMLRLTFLLKLFLQFLNLFLEIDKFWIFFHDRLS